MSLWAGASGGRERSKRDGAGAVIVCTGFLFLFLFFHLEGRGYRAKADWRIEHIGAYGSTDPFPCNFCSF